VPLSWYFTPLLSKFDEIKPKKILGLLNDGKTWHA
jgi:hypothetical protein